MLEAHHIDDAFDWLCKRRRDYPPQADIWWLRRNWQIEKTAILRQLRNGSYTFEPLLRVQRRDGSYIELWSARDALVLKMLSMAVADYWEIPPHCTHVAGNGGSHAAVRQVSAALPDYKFVFRTDVRAFYASINHDVLLQQLYERITDVGLRRLMYQYVKRVVNSLDCS